MPQRSFRRGRSPHPGVVILRKVGAGGDVSYYARWVDPLTGRRSKQSLTTLGLRNAEARREWAIAKSRSLNVVTSALAIEGDFRPQGKIRMPDALEDYLLRRQRRRPQTLVAYRKDILAFIRYAEQRGVTTMDAVGPTLIEAFRDHLLARPKLVQVAGGSVGEKRPSEDRLSPSTVNRTQRHVKAFLNDARVRRIALRLQSDDVSGGFRKEPEPRPRKVILRAQAPGQLLEAALRHDQCCYDLTRDEKEGAGEPGGTRRYAPITPFVMTVLLAGARVAEAAAFRWELVFLNGHQNSEIVVDASMVKTNQERSIYLNVCPGLVDLLAALKLKAGEDDYVFGGSAPLPRYAYDNARRRLVDHFGAPEFTWQQLRQTASSYLANAPGIYGSAAPYHAAAQLGHSIITQERSYVGLVKNIPRTAQTLEEAMGVVDIVKRIIAFIGGERSGADRQVSA